jgi:hypothetical protein
MTDDPVLLLLLLLLLLGVVVVITIRALRTPTERERERERERAVATALCLSCAPPLTDVFSSCARACVWLGGRAGWRAGSPSGSPQFHDCHQRTSGIVPAVVCTVCAVLFLPLGIGLDPDIPAPSRAGGDGTAFSISMMI